VKLLKKCEDKCRILEEQRVLEERTREIPKGQVQERSW
jgi:hypothetical protein